MGPHPPSSFQVGRPVASACSMSRDRVAATRYLVGGGKEGGSHRRDGKGQGARCGDPPRGHPSARSHCATLRCGWPYRLSLFFSSLWSLLGLQVWSHLPMHIRRITTDTIPFVYTLDGGDEESKCQLVNFNRQDTETLTVTFIQGVRA